MVDIYCEHKFELHGCFFYLFIIYLKLTIDIKQLKSQDVVSLLQLL